MSQQIEYCIFILTNRRPNKQYTYSFLKKAGLEKKVFFVLDNLDPTIAEYKKKYGDEKILTFDKEKYIKENETMINEKVEKVVLYARNACYDLAEQLGFQYFIEFDDDYKSFQYQKVENLLIERVPIIKNFEKVIQAYFQFFVAVPSMYSICFSQAGEIISGGADSYLQKGWKRKMMNSFFLDTKRRINFKGVLNEDVNANIEQLKLGHLCLTCFNVVLKENQTQKTKGGLTEIYLQFGTYKKTFFSVMSAPASVKVCTLNSKYPRLHHLTTYKNLMPLIVSECVKKH